MDRIFEFRYTDCIYESAMAAISLHRTKTGAYKAMNNYLNTRFIEERNEHLLYGKSQSFDHIFKYEAWRVVAREILP